MSGFWHTQRGPMVWIVDCQRYTVLLILYLVTNVYYMVVPMYYMVYISDPSEKKKSV